MKRIIHAIKQVIMDKVLMNKYFITCPRGLEQVTANDINQYLEKKCKIDKGGVAFESSQDAMYRINLYSRTGMYVLKELCSFNASNDKTLYKICKNFKWSKLIDVNQTFSLKSKINSSFFKNSNFTTLKIKDAIVDSIKNELGDRPSIDKQNPDVRIFIMINHSKVKLYLDTTGKPLFRRGYRTKIHKAALNETMAAGLVLLSDWNKKDDFYDIMCGSGTIAIEAALIAYNIPPGILRDFYAFQKFSDYNPTLWKSILEEAKKNINFNNPVQINGSDLIKKNIHLALDSIGKLNLEDKIRFSVKDFNDFSPKNKKGTIIINPPYGERIGEQFNLNQLYKKLGDKFKTDCAGHDVFVFTGNLSLIKKIGLRSKRKIILKNGTIDCRLVYYPIQSGSFQ